MLELEFHCSQFRKYNLFFLSLFFNWNFSWIPRKDWLLLPPFCLWSLSLSLHLASTVAYPLQLKNRWEEAGRARKGGSRNIRWLLGVYCKSPPQIYSPLGSECPSNCSSQPLKLQPPTDQSLKMISTVLVSIFAFIIPFDVSATLFIGQSPVCKLIIRLLSVLSLKSPVKNQINAVFMNVSSSFTFFDNTLRVGLSAPAVMIIISDQLLPFWNQG